MSDNTQWLNVEVPEEVIPLRGGLCNKIQTTPCLVVTYKENGKERTDKFVEVKKKSDFLCKAITGQSYSQQSTALRNVTVIEEIREKLMEAIDRVLEDDTAVADALTDDVEDFDPMNALQELLATDQNAIAREKKEPKKKTLPADVVFVDMPKRAECTRKEEGIVRIACYRVGKPSRSKWQPVYIRLDAMDWFLSYAA